MRTVTIGGIETATGTMSELADMIDGHISTFRDRDPSCILVFDINGHAISLFARDEAYRRAMLSADIIHADGQPVVLLSRFVAGGPIRERSATTDLIHVICARCGSSSRRVFLLGASDEVLRRAAGELERRYPGINIVGIRSGYFSKTEENDVCEQISRANVDVLFVGMGKPREQLFLVENRHRLMVRWAVTVGGCFDFLAGSVPRAPGWLQAAGFEWAYRLWREPKRLWRRYLTTNLDALWLIATRTAWQARAPLRSNPEPQEPQHH